jgi:hypothetical protein
LTVKSVGFFLANGDPVATASGSDLFGFADFFYKAHGAK